MMSKAESGVNCLAKSLNQRQLPLSAKDVDILLPQLPVRSVSCSPGTAVRLANGLQHYLASPRHRNFR